MGVPILATALIKVLARRGYRIAAELRRAGWEPLEVYPFATLWLLGLPTEKKRTPLGRRRIHHALQALVPGLEHPDASEHQLDATVCALTAHLWRQGRTTTVGAADEGLMIIPDVTAATGASDRARSAPPPRGGGARALPLGWPYAVETPAGSSRTGSPPPGYGERSGSPLGPPH